MAITSYDSPKSQQLYNYNDLVSSTPLAGINFKQQGDAIAANTDILTKDASGNYKTFNAGEYFIPTKYTPVSSAYYSAGGKAYAIASPQAYYNDPTKTSSYQLIPITDQTSGGYQKAQANQYSSLADLQNFFNSTFGSATTPSNAPTGVETIAQGAQNAAQSKQTSDYQKLLASMTTPTSGTQSVQTNNTPTGGSTADQLLQQAQQMLGQQGTPVSSYSGPSIVDYLNSVGHASDFASRSALAKQYGISGYTGTAEQNTQLLNTLRSSGTQQQQQGTSYTGQSAPQQNFVSTTQAQPVNIQAELAKYGYNVDPQSFVSNPTQSFEDTHNHLYNQLGIGDLKSQSQDLVAQVTSLDSARADEIAKINSDPWLTEGVRQSRIQKVNDKYDMKKAAVTNTLALYDKTISSLTDQAQFLTKATYDQYNADRNFAQNQLQIIYDRIDKANQAQIDIQKEARASQQQSFDNQLAQARLKIDQYNADTSRINANKSGGGSGPSTDQLYSGLSSQAASAIRTEVNKFGTNQTVQNFATIQDGYNFVHSLSNTTTNPADDQALIYALAKALDPNSVVREGEYATAQKYSQSWLNAYGKSVSQAIAGTGFLSTTARENIKKTIESRYNASKQSYDNVYNQTANTINNITGRNDGTQFLVDYTLPQFGGAGGDYSALKTQLRPGEVLVLRSGQPYAIYLPEFNPATDKAI